MKYDFFAERREIREFRHSHPPRPLRALQQYGARWFGLIPLRVRLTVTRPTPGSESWHKTQDILASAPSVGPAAIKRSYFYSRTLISCGNQLYVHPNVTINYPQNLTLGNHILLNRGVNITARAPITIGDDSMIGQYVTINSGNHRFTDRAPIRTQGHETAPIVIGRDVWIGAHAVILPGVHVGDGSVIAAGAIVVGDVPPFTVVAGSPATIVKGRFHTSDDDPLR